MDDILEFLFRLLLSLVAWVLLIPVVWILSTPFILIGAICFDGPYRNNVSTGYRRVTTFWSDWGIFMFDF